jgi:hypothetical protein
MPGWGGDVGRRRELSQIRLNIPGLLGQSTLCRVDFPDQIGTAPEAPI